MINVDAQPQFPEAGDSHDLGGELVDPATAEAIGRAQLVKFVPEEFHQQGRPTSAGEFHLAILCRQPGDTLTFGVTSREAAQQAGEAAGWMDLGAGGVGAVWVVTESGNRYGIGNGYAFEQRSGGVYELDSNARKVVLRIGQLASLPGVGTTSAVKSVLVSDEINGSSYPYSWTGKDASKVPVVNEPVDPLLAVREIGDALHRGEAPSAAVADLLRLQHNASFV